MRIFTFLKLMPLVVALSVGMVTTFAVPQAAISKDLVLTGKGTATYKKKKDAMQAREDAISAAIQNAVRKGLQKFVTPDILAEKADVIDNELLPTAVALVKSQEIISEADRNKTYEVILKATIDEDGLQDNLRSLGISQDVGSRKSIAVLIEEFAQGD
ncbi:MAG: hypothetical protein VX498_14370, partial [Myxococcota bacterium]|nr:hypothetical protein [Myxococcota bacterium]